MKPSGLFGCKLSTALLKSTSASGGLSTDYLISDPIMVSPSIYFLVEKHLSASGAGGGYGPVAATVATAISFCLQKGEMICCATGLNLIRTKCC